jgi:hypothetical protein
VCRKCAADPSQRARHHNSASFAQGADRRRHVFTPRERQRGFQTLLAYYLGENWREGLSADAVAYVMRKVKKHYRDRGTLRTKRHFASVD